MLHPLSKLHLSCSLFLTVLDVCLCWACRRKGKWIYRTLHFQASGDRYSGHKVCPTLITVNLLSITGHLRETDKSLVFSLLHPSSFPVYTQLSALYDSSFAVLLLRSQWELRRKKRQRGLFLPSVSQVTLQYAARSSNGWFVTCLYLFAGGQYFLPWPG